MEPLENLKKVRLEKLEKIKALGITPYPSKSRKTQSVNQARQMQGQKVSIAGRIMAIRGHGGVQFFDLRDESGKIQLVFKKDKLSALSLKLQALVDIGDFIDAEGSVFKTDAGEISVLVSDFHLLTKSIRPIPSTWYGFKDVEERYRKRYLDLIMNQKAKEVLVKRSQITNSLRKFLIEKKGYIEVENPVLQPIYGGGRAKPFITHHNTLDTDFYLRISNELYLKRLIVGGMEKVFEINHIFRNEGMDRNHNPEFTMLETMEAYADYNDNMDLIEEMFEFVASDVFGTTKLEFQGTTIDYKRPWKRIKLSELFKKYTGLNLNDVKTVEKATDLAKKLGVHIEDFMTDGEILLEIFEKKCTSELIQPTFVYDYPADFYPLAKRCDYDNRFVESFDIYVACMEMGTNWSEQNDPAILKKTWEEEAKKAEKGNLEAQKFDKDFLEALEYGMPPTSGIGPGIDRWAMVMTNSPSISDVIMFPTMKPEKSLSEKQEKEKKSGPPIDLGIDHQKATELLEQYLKDPVNRKHSLESEAIMRALAKRLGEDEESWGIIGLLHDIDWEMTKDDTKKHCIKTAEILKMAGGTPYLIETIQSHGYGQGWGDNYYGPPEFADKQRTGNVQHALAAAETLTGLIVATALIQPDKKLKSVKLNSLQKKFKNQKFAANCSRNIILECEKIGLTIDEFLETGLKALQDISSVIGL